MNLNKVLKIVLLAIIGIIAYLLFILNKSSSFLSFFNKQKETISPNILYITSPVYSINGDIEKIEGNTVTVSKTLSQDPSLLRPSNRDISPPDSSVQLPKKIIYKAVVTKNTNITKIQNPIPYLFPQTNSFSSDKDIKSLKPGANITLFSKKDLRTIPGNQFEAENIHIQTTSNRITGKIVKLGDNSFSLLGMLVPFPINPQMQVSQKEKEYTIAVTKDTEIARILMNRSGRSEMPKPEKLTISDLKKDMQITAYLDENISKTDSFTALCIRPENEESINPPVNPMENRITPNVPEPKTENDSSPSSKVVMP